MRHRLRLLLVLMLFMWPLASTAQEREAAIWDIFLETNTDGNGTDRINFLNVATGEQQIIEVQGERYTPLAAYVMYFDPNQQMMMTARPDGTIEPHPFIQLGAARRVDWIVSPDQRLIAWTLTYDNVDGLTTVTTVATPAGTNQNLVLSDGPRTDGVRVFPVAFTVDNSSVMIDSQPDGIGDLAPYRQYANLVELSLIDGSITPMPGEPSCFCAAALGAGRLVRLTVTADFRGFDVAIYDLNTEQAQSVTSSGLVDYTQGGDILISPDGTQAVYALSQVDLGATEPTVRTVIMTLNLRGLSQRQLSEPVPSYLYPIAWTEDNTAILFTRADQAGTWKMDANTGQFTRVATAIFLGTIQD